MKIAILTIPDNNNYGNRLQNYATERILIEKFAKNVNTIWDKKVTIYNIKKILKRLVSSKKIKARYNNFKKFTNRYTKPKAIGYNYKNKSNYDYIIIGSDQIWNLNWHLKRNQFLYKIDKEKNISFAASFGVSNIDDRLKKEYIKILNNISKLSVREDRGKEIVEELTGRKDVEVLVDPTMLLTAEEWDKVSKKPKMLKTDKYILNYFLGDLSDERRKEIDRVAKENNCEVINILDKNSPFYECGPSEFLYLEKNAFLICTDSFHSCVFAILYNTPFLVFDREQKNLVSMNSRLDTLLSKFKLENRRCNGRITKKDLTCDYKEAYKILEKERIKADKFLRKALDINIGDSNE